MKLVRDGGQPYEDVSPEVEERPLLEVVSKKSSEDRD
jgi:hypothetical protein